MPQLIAKAAFPYAGRSLQPGDRFEATEKDANLLKMVKRAEDADASPDEPRRRRYQRRDMVAGD